MKTLNSFSKETKQILRLRKLASMCYVKIGDVNVQVSKSREPVAPGNQYSLNYTKIKPGMVWAKHVFDCAWFHVTGKIPAAGEGRHVVLRMDIGGEGTVYEGKRAVQMITSRCQYADVLSAERGKCIIEISPSAQKGESIDVYVDAGFNGLAIMAPFGMGVLRSVSLAVANDECIDAFYDYFTAATYCSTLEGDEKKQACAVLDKAFELLLSGKTAEGRKVLAALLEGTPSDFEFTAIGHSHLDLAWLWPVRETKRKAIRTFTMQLNNIKKIPEYIYGASQPWQFEQMKENQPELYEGLRNAVAQGRLEPQGGMYVEADTNLSGGEALVRQIHYGKDFFNSEFGKDMKICWLPDVFGYSGSLPQILKKTGIPYFFTIKLSWNEHNRFPHRSFVWQGIDGSDVLVHMAPGDDYNGDGSPINIKSAFENYTEKDVSREALYLYGIGDGGGGPSRAHIELLKRQNSLNNSPRVKLGTAVDFFDRLSAVRDRLPVYRGELYLEKHQGTYTTQAHNKMYNRKTEFALQNLEALAACAMLKGYTYPQNDIDRWWKEVLLYQFHDIIPGSSINRVYKESCEGYRKMLGEIENKTNEILEFLSGKGENEIIFNPSPFAIGNVPSWGFGFEENSLDDTSGLTASDGTITNGILTAVFGKDGSIVSLKDKNGTEYSNGTLNRLVMYFDRPLIYNAWDIWWKYHKQKGKTLKACKSEYFVKDGKAVCKNTYRFGASTLVQSVSLKAGSDVLEFDTQCDWHALFRMLRAEFESKANPDTVTCDIQFGRISRSARDNTPEEQAQFEICAHKFVDLSENGNGLSVINDCKYGHRVKNGKISLNLLRSPIFPDPKADRGEQRFAYSLYPHDGECDCRTASRAYALNKPFVHFKGKALPDIAFESSNPEVIIDTVKKSYSGNNIVLRVYENSGKAQTTELKVPFKYDKVTQTDMLENNAVSAEFPELNFAPYEIKTLLFENPQLKETGDK